MALFATDGPLSSPPRLRRQSLSPPEPALPSVEFRGLFPPSDGDPGE